MQARLLGMATTAWCSSPLAVRLLEPRVLTVFADRAFEEIVAGSLAPPECCPSRGTRLGWSD